jgi:hypothetical protein
MISTQEKDRIEILRSIRTRQEAPVVVEDIDVDGVPTYVIRAGGRRSGGPTPRSTSTGPVSNLPKYTASVNSSITQGPRQ